MDIESMARYWTQDAENYGNITGRWPVIAL